MRNTYKNKIYENIKLNLIKNTITLQKLKEIKGRIINTTILKELDNKYKNEKIIKYGSDYRILILWSR